MAACPPECRRWLFVIDEETAIFYAWRTVNGRFRESIDLRVFFCGHVSEPVVSYHVSIFP